MRTLSNEIIGKEPIKDNNLCGYLSKEPLPFTIAEIVSRLDEGIVIDMPHEKETEIICVVYPKYSRGGSASNHMYPNIHEEIEYNLKNIGGAFIGRKGDSFFYRITEEEFKKRFKKAKRLRIERIRRMFDGYSQTDKVRENWFLWKGEYFMFVEEVLKNISKVSEKKYGEPSIFVDAPVVFDDVDELIKLDENRERGR